MSDSTDLFINGNKARPPIIKRGNPLLETCELIGSGPIRSFENTRKQF